MRGSTVHRLVVVYVLHYKVCQYAMNIYHEVPLSVRQPIINVWVETKQLLKEPINKNMGHDREVQYINHVCVSSTCNLL